MSGTLRALVRLESITTYLAETFDGSVDDEPGGIPGDGRDYVVSANEALRTTSTGGSGRVWRANGTHSQAADRVAGKRPIARRPRQPGRVTGLGTGSPRSCASTALQAGSHSDGPNVRTVSEAARVAGMALLMRSRPERGRPTIMPALGTPPVHVSARVPESRIRCLTGTPPRASGSTRAAHAVDESDSDTNSPCRSEVTRDRYFVSCASPGSSQPPSSPR